MATPFPTNYLPPANSVEVVGNSAWRWDGRRWRFGTMPRNPSSSQQLIGKRGTSMEGAYYDWGRKAWMRPERAPAAAAPSGGGALRPTLPFRPPAATPQPQQPQRPPLVNPYPSTPQQETTTMTTLLQPTPCSHVSHREPDVIEQLKRSPYLPLVGLGLSIASDFLKPPQPPQIPEGLPEATRVQWQMTYAQNVAMYQERKSILDKYAQLVLGLTGLQAVASEVARHDDLLKRAG